MQATTTAPLFAATLKPDRSARVAGGWAALGICAFLVMPLAVLAPELALPAGAAFLICGAGLIVLALRQARRRRLAQRVTLWPDQLEIVSIDGRGTRSLRRFDPRTVRLVLHRDANEKTVSLGLRSGMDEFELGEFLGTEDRSSFAQAFGTALRRARQAD
jgi:uncharacterized membrane protein